MTLRLHVLTGGRAGSVVRFRTGPVRVGRAPDADLRLDPERDLAVSGEHAILELVGDTWTVRDLHSTNGTFLNGRWVHGRTPLQEGDRLCLGGSGPLIQIEHEPVREAWVAPLTDTGFTWSPFQPAAPPGGAGEGRGARGRSGADPLPDERRLPSYLPATLTALVVVAAITFVATVPFRRERERREAEVGALAAQLDSLRARGNDVVAGLEARVLGLEEALAGSRAEVDALQVRLARATTDGDEAQARTLRTRIERATRAMENQQRAAAVDFPAVERLNRPALAMITVESDGGRIVSATAFAVRADGLLLTNRHVVDGADGNGPARRIAVQFSDSEQVWPADVVARSPSADLAALRVRNVLGDVPTIAGFNRRPDTLRAGAPVVLLGFPLGGEAAPGDPRARAAVGAGTVRAALPSQLHIEGYGAPGASGSPVLDSEGRLVGILQGGQERDDGTTLVAVPAARALRFLEDVVAREQAGR